MNPIFQSFSNQIDAQIPKASPFFLGLFESPPDFTPDPFFEKFDDYFRELAVALIDNEFIDLMMAERITDILKELLVLVGNYPSEKQTLIYGAAQYFLESEDAIADKSSPEGLKDDIVVLNIVLEAIDRLDLQIKS